MKRLFTFVITVSLLCAICFPAQAYSNVYQSKKDAGKRVALTFDDGPHPIYTHRILNILDRYGVKATFFVVGCNVENYPEAFREIANSKNEIGNHTYSHRNIGDMSEAQIRSEVKLTEEAIASHSVRHASVLRPPEGHFGNNLKKVSEDEGYDIVLWSIDTLDWAHTPADKIATKVLLSLSDGDIILMHDYTSGRAHTCEALELMIPKMLEMGYEFVTVSELICEE